VIVLDTHAWIWAVSDPDRLSRPARTRIGAARSVGVAAVSMWELAMLVAKKRIALDRDTLRWIRDALTGPKMALLPLTPEIAVLSVGIGLHGDPSDRMIVATALEHGADLVTADASIQKASVVRCVW
jgi:PIN domain nuclease of toxin-antitoxin system